MFGHDNNVVTVLFSHQYCSDSLTKQYNHFDNYSEHGCSINACRDLFKDQIVNEAQPIGQLDTRGVPRHFLMVSKIALKFVKVVIFTKFYFVLVKRSCIFFILKNFSTHLRTWRIGRYAPGYFVQQFNALQQRNRKSAI